MKDYEYYKELMKPMELIMKASKSKLVVNCGRHVGRTMAYKYEDEFRQIMKIIDAKVDGYFFSSSLSE